jgi:hypothetical protein
MSHLLIDCKLTDDAVRLLEIEINPVSLSQLLLHFRMNLLGISKCDQQKFTSVCLYRLFKLT